MTQNNNEAVRLKFGQRAPQRKRTGTSRGYQLIRRPRPQEPQR